MKKRNSEHTKPADITMGRRNYVLLAAGVAGLAVGYGGMLIEKSVDGFFSLSVSPLLIISSYCLIMFSLLYRGKQDSRK
ncbi:hypothetical protein [Prosthecochloris sp. HL-130-GSB]|jgi:hypothetical protein|uniref:DUF3098 domain-containing protein n=1 Tax=Prosthecochloris aestuarii TaxID=1102 RepID=A0A831SSB8_PROAE|nr:hypothetical protein [Prosthecochloris sp. HL-130-GSB]ARM30447.1 hypothetical protein B9H02_02760 [Prosthecochloris sp. HL-130-GSB]MBO8093329.1 hypothetical protein [Prosthecochloris sp.]HED31724.1 hypothetical protein [Prosthecochloris aestuarii]